MTQTIEQLTARVRELEEENARLKTVPMKYRRMAFNAQLQDESQELRAQLAAAQEECEFQRNAHKQAEELMLEQSNQLAAAQAYAEQLLEALEKLATIANQYAGHYPYQVATIVDAALSLPADTSALDAYVEQKMKEAYACCCVKLW